MGKIFYTYWVDSIVGFRNNNPDQVNWKIVVFIYNTTCNSLNLATIYAWLIFFEVSSLDLVDFKISSIRSLNGFFNYTIQFASPFLVLNYFLIFHRNRYKKLINRYQNKNGKIALYYSMISIAACFISLIVVFVILR